MKIKTINKHFNDAWNYLQEKHESLVIADRYWIDMTKKPKLDQKEWIFYVDKLIELIEIGRRNNWLSLHVDGKGLTAYLVLNYQKCLTNKKGEIKMHRWAIMKDGKEIGNLGWFTEDCEELFVLDYCKEKGIKIKQGEEVKIVEAK